jgi:hypothetical protein
VSGIRSADPSDLLEVAALRRRVFTQSTHHTDEALAAYYRAVFFENPWRDDRYTPVVYVGEQERILGFLGVIPRPMLFAGRRITGVSTAEFMVSPESRGVIGPRLLRRILDGPQDFTYSDRATDTATAMYEAFGGISVVWNSLYWSVPLDRVALRYEMAGQSEISFASRVLRKGARSLERLAGRLTKLPSIPAGVAEQPLDPQTVVESIRNVVGHSDLYPEYDRISIDWLLERIRERPQYERLSARRLARDSLTIGWYIYAIREGDTADVIQTAAVPGEEAVVFDALLHGIARDGGRIAHGRLDRRFASVVMKANLPLTLARPWVGMHSRNPEITTAFATGRVFLSRLDAEWWLGF